MGKKLFSIFVNALCVVAIVFSLLAGWTAITTPRGKVPSLFGVSMLTVLTGSMAPALPEKSLILVRETAPAQIRVGDIITFYTSIAGYDGVVNTHRVTEVKSDEGTLAFRTQGDANALEDSTLVAEGQLVGQVFFHSLILGIIVSFLRMPIVFFLIILIPLLLVVVRSILQLVRLGKEEVRKAEQELRDKHEFNRTYPEEARHEQDER